MAKMSINTNVGSMVALKYLNETNKELATTQDRISTGLKVNSAKDQAAAFSIAQRMNSDVKGYESVKAALGLGDAATNVAVKAGESIKDLLIDMKAKIVQAGNDGQGAAALQALQTDILALRGQIDTIVDSAEFNGINLLNNDPLIPSMTVLSSVDGVNKITVAAQPMDQTSLGINVLDVTNTAGATAALTAINTAIDSNAASLANFGSNQQQIEVQTAFTQDIIDSLRQGVGILVDADMAEESARLTAMQTKQQLGVQSLAIANSTPQTLLSLFG